MEHHIIKARSKTPTAPGIRVKDMQKSLDFYTKTLGFQTTDKLILTNGEIVHASVGFDSPLLVLSPVEYVRTPETKEDLAMNKLGVGVEFLIWMDGSGMLDELVAEVRAKGIAVINERRTQFAGKKFFTVTDPDGYAISFAERVENGALQRTKLKSTPPQRPRRRPYVSIFST